MERDKPDVLHGGEYLWQKLKIDYVARLVFYKQDLSLDEDLWYKMRGAVGRWTQDRKHTGQEVKVPGTRGQIRFQNNT